MPGPCRSRVVRIAVSRRFHGPYLPHTFQVTSLNVVVISGPWGPAAQSSRGSAPRKRNSNISGEKGRAVILLARANERSIGESMWEPSPSMS